MIDKPAISVRGLTKIFDGRKVVDNFDMDVAPGTIHGFLGPNGSGKTTTIRMMCGLLTPDAGQGQCLGHDIRRDSQKIKQNVGYMTQRFSLYEDLTVRENLDFIARMFGMPDRRTVVAQALAHPGLGERADQLAGTLSGGWKQRLALAACTIHRPRLLLLDEPTAGVDPKARRDFWDEIRQLAARGVTALVSTHYMDEAVQCDMIAYIAFGRKLISGRAQDIPAQLGLYSWRVDGTGIDALESKLRQDERLAQVVRFGDVLHVSGTDENALDAVAEQNRKSGPQRWRRQAPTLEDAFIFLMERSSDHSAPHSESSR